MLGVAEETRHPPFALRTFDVRGSSANAFDRTRACGYTVGKEQERKDGEEYLACGARSEPGGCKPVAQGGGT